MIRLAVGLVLTSLAGGCGTILPHQAGTDAGDGVDGDANGAGSDAAGTDSRMSDAGSQDVAVTVTIVSGNPGMNVVESTPAGISCSSTTGTTGCTHGFPPGSTIKLMATADATPDKGGRFIGYDGASDAQPVLTLTLPSSPTQVDVTATFDWFATLTIVMNAGEPGGCASMDTACKATTAPAAVQSYDPRTNTPTAITCTTTSLGGTCTAGFGNNAQVMLTYTPDPASPGTWTNCHGVIGSHHSALSVSALGDCAPPTGIGGYLCTDADVSCPSSESCSITLGTAGKAYTSQYNVTCEVTTVINP